MTPFGEVKLAIAHGLHDVCGKVARFADNGLTSDDLAVIETALDPLQRSFREVFDEYAPDGSWAAETPGPELEPVLHAWVATVSFLDVVARLVQMEMEISWGSHLFGHRNVNLVDFDRLQGAPNSRQLAILLPEASADLLDAFREVAQGIAHPGAPSISDVKSHLEVVCEQFADGLEWRESFGFRLLRADEMAEILDTGRESLEAMMSARRVLYVHSWSGETMFPDFQLTREGIHGLVGHVLENCHGRLTGWPLALWLADQVENERSEGFVEATLGERGLWKPYWTEAETGSFDDLSNPEASGSLPGPFFRVAAAERTPFYFAAHSDHADPGADTGSSEDGRETESPKAPSGRFDLPIATGNGSLYLAEEAVGACHEVLDREIVLTLSDVLRRTMWTLTPVDPIRDVADLRSYSTRLSATRNRRDTRAIAGRLAARFNGLRAVLRTAADQVGVVLFGLAGPSYPSAAGLGIWEVEASPLAERDELWEYIERRGSQQAAFPVILRRFPISIDG